MGKPVFHERPVSLGELLETHKKEVSCHMIGGATPNRLLVEGQPMKVDSCPANYILLYCYILETLPTHIQVPMQ